MYNNTVNKVYALLIFLKKKNKKNIRNRLVLFWSVNSILLVILLAAICVHKIW